MTAIILYGPPAAGKNTVTAALSSLDGRYELYRRAKLGPGRTTGYRMINESQVARLRQSGKILWENHRYGAIYFVDELSLQEVLDRSRVPIIHLGQPEAVKAVTGLTHIHWFTVNLWCSRETAERRIRNRATGDTSARLKAWDATPQLRAADLRINTDVISATATASMIAERLKLTLGNTITTN